MAEKTKVLLVEVFPKVAQKIRALLERIDFIEFLPSNISNSEMALDAVRQSKPDIVLLELDLPGINGIQCTEIIKRDYPAIQVIILSEISSAETVRLAMRAGAVDYLNYNNLTFDEFLSVVERTVNIVQQEKIRTSLRQLPTKEAQTDSRKPSARDGKVLAVYSPKGGVGVSTIVANLGYQFKESRKENMVLLVDLDLQYGDISLLYNQVTNRSIIDLAIRVQNLDMELIETVIISDQSSGVDFLASPAKLELSHTLENAALAQIIEQLRHMYDYIIINTSSHLSENVVACLAISDLILLVTNQQVITVRAIRSFLNLLREAGIGKEKIVMIINKFEEENTITPRKISEMLSLNVAATILYDQKTAEKSANLGIPFTLDNPKLEISKSYRNLVKSIKNMLAEKEKLAI